MIFRAVIEIDDWFLGCSEATGAGPTDSAGLDDHNEAIRQALLASSSSDTSDSEAEAPKPFQTKIAPRTVCFVKHLEQMVTISSNLLQMIPKTGENIGEEKLKYDMKYRYSL